MQKQQLEDKIKQVHASRRKSLIQIQSQEKALMELMEFYEISSGPFGGEWFEILWNANRKFGHGRLAAQNFSDPDGCNCRFCVTHQVKQTPGQAR